MEEAPNAMAEVVISTGVAVHTEKEEGREKVDSHDEGVEDLKPTAAGFQPKKGKQAAGWNNTKRQDAGRNASGERRDAPRRKKDFALETQAWPSLSDAKVGPQTTKSKSPEQTKDPKATSSSGQKSKSKEADSRKKKGVSWVPFKDVGPAQRPRQNQNKFNNAGQFPAASTTTPNPNSAPFTPSNLSVPTPAGNGTPQQAPVVAPTTSGAATPGAPTVSALNPNTANFFPNPNRQKRPYNNNNNNNSRGNYRGRPNNNRRGGATGAGGAGAGRYPAPFPSDPFYGAQYRFYSPNFMVEPLEGEALKDAIRKQAEYYFSVDNLCKDIFLRSKMDSEGYVPLDLVAAFNKLKYLVKDRVLLSEILKTSTAIEFDAERQLLRRRGDWNQWLLSADGTATNEKPASPQLEEGLGREEEEKAVLDSEKDEKTAKGELEVVGGGGGDATNEQKEEVEGEESDENGMGKVPEEGLGREEQARMAKSISNSSSYPSSKDDSQKKQRVGEGEAEREGEKEEVVDRENSAAQPQQQGLQGEEPLGDDSWHTAKKKRRGSTKASPAEVRGGVPSMNGGHPATTSSSNSTGVDSGSSTSHKGKKVEEWQDEEEQEVADEYLSQLIIITQSPVKTKYEKEKEREKEREKGREKESGGSGGGLYSDGPVCRRALQEELTSVINDGLFFYERDLKSRHRTYEQENRPVVNIAMEGGDHHHHHAVGASTSSPLASSISSPASAVVHTKTVNTHSNNNTHSNSSNHNAHNNNNNRRAPQRLYPLKPKDEGPSARKKPGKSQQETGAFNVGWVAAGSGQGESPLDGGSSSPDVFPFYPMHPSHALLKENGFIQHKYHQFHDKCLKDRKKKGIGRSSEMNTLYRFWSHFLRTHFNRRMYNELKSLAIADLKENYRFYSFGLELKFRPDIFEDFQAIVLMDYHEGHLYALEKFWAFLKFGRDKVLKSYGPLPRVDKELQDILRQCPTLEDLRNLPLEDSKNNNNNKSSPRVEAKAKDVPSSADFPPLSSASSHVKSSAALQGAWGKGKLV